MELYTAAKEGNTELVRQHLRVAGINVNFRNANDQETPLIVAARMGHVQVVEMLLKDQRVSPFAQNSSQASVLMVACQNGHVPVVKLLLEVPGIGVNEIMNDTVTPLYMASRSGNAQIVELLLKHPQIQVNKAKFDNATPLIIASVKGHISVVELLLNHPGIDVSKVSDYYLTALTSAHFWGHKRIVLEIQKFKDNEQFSLEKDIEFITENLDPAKRFQDACGIFLEKIVISEETREAVLKYPFFRKACQSSGQADTPPTLQLPFLFLPDGRDRYREKGALKVKSLR